jgi:response regulator RpfG family c-di-GMP phosphodiesterase
MSISTSPPGTAAAAPAKTAVKRPRVLCVDDDPGVLEGLELSLSRQFEVITAVGGEAAVAILKQTRDLHVLISDMRMPGMSGIEVLAKAHELQPDATRVLLTGYADMDSAIAAINQGHIFRFLNKPCKREDLIEAVIAAARQYQLVTAEHVLLEQTLKGCVQSLIDALALAAPNLFGQANRVRAMARQLAEKAGQTRIWELEVAALLFNLGLIGIDPDVVERHLNGEVLSGENKKMIESAPDRGDKLLAHIPRLETVRTLIRLAFHSRRGEHAPETLVLSDRVLALTNILEIANKYCVLEARGYSPDAALTLMRSETPADQAPTLHHLEDVLGREVGATSLRELPLAALKPGMILAQPLRTASGQLLAPAGYEVTESFADRARNVRPGTVIGLVRVLIPA